MVISMLLAALAIRIESRGPILFRQTRLKIRAAGLGIRKIEGWPGGATIEFDADTTIDPAQIIALIEQLKEEHKTWQQENLKVKPMWPRIMDKRFVLDGKEYLFPA